MLWQTVLIGNIKVIVFWTHFEKRKNSYEIQLIPGARGQGLGEFLMNLLSQIGTYWEMDKVMLTVFKGELVSLFLFHSKK